jgi:hypothetical protein
MALKKRDWIFIAIIAAVFGIFIAISGEEKTTRVPLDEAHRPFYDMIDSGQKKIDVDPHCADCHDGVKIPFPPNHPAKPGSAPMRCLFCHKLQGH